MRALSLTQPYAGIVIAGIKPDENRDNLVIARADFGQPFAVHATREIDEDAYRGIRMAAPQLWETHACAISGGWSEDRPESWPAWYRLTRVTSAVIGVATVDCVAVVHQGWLRDPRLQYERICPMSERPFARGPWVYMLRDAHALETPVPCRGWQGFWHLTAKDERDRGEVSAVERAVVAQLARAA